MYAKSVRLAIFSLMQPLRAVTCALLVRCHRPLAVLLHVTTVTVGSIPATWVCLHVLSVPLAIIQAPQTAQTVYAQSVTQDSTPALVPLLVKIARGERPSQTVDRNHALDAHLENFKMTSEEQRANDAALTPHTTLRQTTLI